MRCSNDPVPALECNACLWMLVPKLHERVTRNDPHAGLYHVPNLGTSRTWVAPLSCGRSSARLVLLVVLSQPYPGTAAVLVDKLDAGGSVLCVGQPRAPQCLEAPQDIILREIEQSRQKFTREQDRAYSEYQIKYFGRRR